MYSIQVGGCSLFSPTPLKQTNKQQKIANKFSFLLKAFIPCVKSKFASFIFKQTLICVSSERFLGGKVHVLILVSLFPPSEKKGVPTK